VIRLVFIGALALLAAGATACTSINPTTTASANGHGPSYTYVAIGDSGTNSFHDGPPDLRSQWTQIFYRSTVGTHGTLYDLTSGGQTVAEALSSVLPQALAAHPQLAIVWIGTADIVAGTAPSVYEQELQQLVEALEHGGATVLLANAPPPEFFGALSASESGSSVSTQARQSTKTSAQAFTVSAYDGVIGSVARQTGAGLVDVHSALQRAEQDGGVEGLLSPDGTALSKSGATVVAHALEAQLPRRFRRTK
jgi:lysophospholipase L1-like esterase